MSESSIGKYSDKDFYYVSGPYFAGTVNGIVDCMFGEQHPKIVSNFKQYVFGLVKDPESYSRFRANKNDIGTLKSLEAMEIYNAMRGKVPVYALPDIIRVLSAIEENTWERGEYNDPNGTLREETYYKNTQK